MIIIWMTLGLVATVAAVRAAVYYGTPRGDRANAHMLRIADAQASSRTRSGNSSMRSSRVPPLSMPPQ